MLGSVTFLCPDRFVFILLRTNALNHYLRGLLFMHIGLFLYQLMKFRKPQLQKINTCVSPPGLSVCSRRKPSRALSPCAKLPNHCRGLSCLNCRQFRSLALKSPVTARTHLSHSLMRTSSAEAARWRCFSLTWLRIIQRKQL